MRDIFLTAFVFGSIPYILRRPHIGVMMYVWLSVMNPHRLTWGFAYDFNFAAVIAAVTLFSAVVSRDRVRLPVNAVTIALFLFGAWTAVTTVFAFYPAGAYEKWVTLMKTLTMAFLIPILFHRKAHLRQLIWVLVLSIAYYGAKGGAWFVLTGGGGRVFGPPGSYIEDNNALAVAVIMMIPLMRYLQLTTSRKVVKWGLSGMMALSGIGVLGSYSRGALVAVCTMLVFLLWKSHHRLTLSLFAVLMVPVALSYMPERWYQRMDTIAAYEHDGSANMRLNAWGTMFNIARDRPLVGGGFEVDEKAVFDRYSPDPTFPPQVAHSIYFQAMGEHGFVGLALFLLLYFAMWWHSGALVRASRNRRELEWARHLGLMMQVTLIGYAVGGAFLSLVNYDVPYYLVAVIVAARALVALEVRPARGVRGAARFTGVHGAPSPAATDTPRWSTR